MPITSGNVEKALNEFRSLMKPCFIDQNSFTDTEVDIGSGIKIPPKIQDYASDNTDKITDSDLTETDSIQIDKSSQVTYDKIQIYDTSADTPIKDYIPYNKYTLEDIREAVDSDPNVRSTHREYLSHLIYHYIQLIILSAIAIKITSQSGELYTSYKTYITNYITNVRDIDTGQPIQNYVSNKSKVFNSSSSFVEQKTYNKKIINEIEDNERHLDYLYLYIYFIITLLVVIILFCILFKNKNNYLIAVLVLLILINAYFSKYVVLIEGFADIVNGDNCDIHSNPIKFHLCQALNVVYQRFKSSRLPIIEGVSNQLIVENKLYTGLYNKAKNINLNTKDKINIDTFSFYRRKAYTNLFMRIVILGILLLILYNIFGYNYIIVILGIVLFCLILMVYFYTLKHISRTNYRTKNWI
tara:strand:- start:45 stop:1283 length:1239 start_codon:yes stop_codon:yes gene_type:complete